MWHKTSQRWIWDSHFVCFVSYHISATTELHSGSLFYWCPNRKDLKYLLKVSVRIWNLINFVCKMNVHRVQYEYPEFIFNEFRLFEISCSTWRTISFINQQFVFLLKAAAQMKKSADVWALRQQQQWSEVTAPGGSAGLQIGQEAEQQLLAQRRQINNKPTVSWAPLVRKNREQEVLRREEEAAV